MSLHNLFMVFFLDLQSECDVVETVIRIIFVICALIWCTLFCYFGDMASDRLSSIGFAAYSANWYDYPVEWQKFFILMILRTRKPAYFDGLNLINCNLEVLGKVKTEFTFVTKYFNLQLLRFTMYACIHLIFFNCSSVNRPARII